MHQATPSRITSYNVCYTKLLRYYPEATIADWTDWRWQNRHRVRTLIDLQRMVDLSEDEIAAIRAHTGALPVGIT